jgi:ribonuclease HII
VDCEIEGLDDSKKLTEKKREKLFDVIKEKAIAYSVASVDEKTIDEINILQADFVAMRKAVENLSVKADFALVDGNQYPNTGIKELCIVKGDSISPSIAAASILAKVSRDRYMLELDKKYPEYQFARHKGYGTKLHYECIEKYGFSPVHRRSFLKKILGDNNE